MSEADVRALVHELQVHQIELEMQNEELLHAQAEAQEAADKFTELFDFAPVGYFVLDWPGRVQQVNLAGAALLGLDRHRVVGQRFAQYVAPDSRASYEAFCRNVRQGKTKQTCQLKLLKHAQGTCDVLIEGILAADGDGGSQGWRLAVIDITERKRCEAVLQRINEVLEHWLTERSAQLRDKAQGLEESEARYRSLVTASAQIVWTTNAGGEVLADIPAWRAFTGQTYDEIKGRGWASALHPDDLERTQTAWKHSVAERSLYEAEYRVRREDGEYRHFAVRGVPVIEKDGSIREWTGACTDITEHKAAEERRNITHALLALFARKSSSKEYLEEVVEVIRAWTDCQCLGIRVADENGGIPYSASVGFDAEFLRVENRLSLKTDNCCCIRAISQAIEEQDRSLLTPGGSLRCDNTTEFVSQLSPQQQARYRGNCVNAGFASVAVVPIRYHDRVLGALHLADRRPARFLLATVQFLESMSPLIGEAIQRFQTEAELAKHRDQFEALVNQRTSELEAVNARLDGIVSSAMDAVISIDPERRVVLFNEAAEKVFGMSAKEALGQSIGRFIPERFRAAHVRHVSQFGETGASSRAMGSLGTLSGLRANGKEFPIEASISQAEVQGEKLFTVVLRDVTEPKKAEEALQQTTNDLERSNADLQQFAYVASHDLQEPLRAVDGYVKLLRRSLPDKLDAKAFEYITGVVDGAARMEKLISDLLAFSRIGTYDGDFSPADLNMLLSDALNNLQASIKAAHAKVTTDRLPAISVNASQVTRLFQNLIGNAIKFRSERPPEIHIGARQQPGLWLFSVRDNGIGIGPEHFDRIFQIFQRLHTRTKYPGTGIGLAVCKKIVERHGGTIWVESHPGEGSTFCFSIPASSGLAAPALSLGAETQCTNRPEK